MSQQLSQTNINCQQQIQSPCIQSKQPNIISSIKDSFLMKTEFNSDNVTSIDKNNSLSDKYLDENSDLEKICKCNYQQYGKLQREDENIDENYFFDNITNCKNNQYEDSPQIAHQTIKQIDFQHRITNKKIQNFSSEGGFDLSLFVNSDLEEGKIQTICSKNFNNNIQKYIYKSINSYKQYDISMKQQINYHNLVNDQNLTPQNQNFTNDQSNKGYQYNFSPIGSSSIISCCIDNYSISNQKQNQQLQGINNDISSFQCYDMNQCYQNYQLKQQFYKNQAEVFNHPQLESNNLNQAQMINKNRIYQSNQSDDESQNKTTEQIRQNIEIKQYDKCNSYQSNTFSFEQIDDLVENQGQKICESDYLNNQINYCDEEIVYDSDKQQKSEVSYPYDVLYNSQNNDIEQSPKFNDCHPQYQQLLFINNNESDNETQFRNINDQNVENQGVLVTQPLQQLVENNNNNEILNSKQPKLLEQNNLKIFQELKLESINLQINLQQKEQINFKQKINQNKQIEDFFQLDNSTIEIKSNPFISRDDAINNLNDSQPHLSKQPSESCKESKDTLGDEETQQDSKIMKGTDNIIDKIIHLNKKNMVRNIIRAFKKYFLNKKSNPPAPIQFFPNQKLDVSRSEFKTYFSTQKFNNSILKKLITHHQYGQVFHDFLLNKSNEYLDHSNIKAKESHELYVNFLVLCYDDLEKLSHLETYQKLQAL